MISSTSIEGRVTTVEVQAELGSDAYPLGITGRGKATCRKDDVFNKGTGRAIATGRAIQDFGKQVEQAGHDSVTSVAELDKVLAALFG